MKQFIDKLIERLEEYQENNTQNKSDDDYELGQFNMCEKAIEIVNQLAEEHKDDIQTIDVSELLGEPVNDGWIACSERLPDIGERVFVWVYGRVCIGKRIDAKLFDEYDIFSLENGSNESTKRIDAWQPLPAPFKPKGKPHD